MNYAKLRTAVLVSGGGTNLQALIDYQADCAASGKECPYEIVCVIADTKKAFALERAAKANIPTEICSPYAVMGEEAAKAAEAQAAAEAKAAQEAEKKAAEEAAAAAKAEEKKAAAEAAAAAKAQKKEQKKEIRKQKRTKKMIPRQR